MNQIVITALVGCGLSLGLGYLLLPLLRALKAGQSIREVGPTWHNSKAGTPMMGGLMFIFATIICLLLSIPVMKIFLCSMCWRWVCVSVLLAFWMIFSRPNSSGIWALPPFRRHCCRWRFPRFICTSFTARM